MDQDTGVEFPKMLYRPGCGPEVVWNELIDTRTVRSLDEQRFAVRDGWLVEAAKALESAKARRERPDLTEEDTRSEATVLVEKSISLAHDPSIRAGVRRRVLKHLAFIQPRLREHNTLLPQVREALRVLGARLPWYQRPLGVVVLAVMATVIGAGIVWLLGWNK